MEVVSSKKFVSTYKFNFGSEFTTEENAQSVFSTLEEFKADCNQDLIVEPNFENKFILIEDKSKGDL